MAKLLRLARGHTVSTFPVILPSGGKYENLEENNE
jgi:hypothetical protein